MNDSCARCGHGPGNINAGPDGFVCSICWSEIVGEHSVRLGHFNTPTVKTPKLQKKRKHK